VAPLGWNAKLCGHLPAMTPMISSNYARAGNTSRTALPRVAANADVFPRASHAWHKPRGQNPA